jgi:ADP-ribose pyrophosphatase YjhB (NUDIX family)
MTNYVLGFLFDTDMRHLVLIRKNRPTWMVGKWNALGGCLEEGEGFCGAVVRECEEESGIRTEESEWTEFAGIKGDGFRVVCFYATTKEIMNADGHTSEDERAVVCSVSGLSELQLVPDVQWLAHAAIMRSKHPDNYVMSHRRGHPHLT